MSEESAFRFSEAEISKKNGDRLPHWSRDESSYHVVFRLADSLPQSVLEQLRDERERLSSLHRLGPGSQRELDYLMSEKIDESLDAGTGECFLRRDEIAQIVWSALSHFDGTRYELPARCVMPNHVHLLIQPAPSFGLDEIMHSLKSFTANQANRELGRKGGFWMPEYYDHLIRSEMAFDRVRQYILDNPVKAGLKNWK
jgi:REP element-mobilizing transposase RayT